MGVLLRSTQGDFQILWLSSLQYRVRSRPPFGQGFCKSGTWSNHHLKAPTLNAKALDLHSCEALASRACPVYRVKGFRIEGVAFRLRGLGVLYGVYYYC